MINSENATKIKKNESLYPTWSTRFSLSPLGDHLKGGGDRHLHRHCAEGYLAGKGNGGGGGERNEMVMRRYRCHHFDCEVGNLEGRKGGRGTWEIRIKIWADPYDVKTTKLNQCMSEGTEEKMSNERLKAIERKRSWCDEVKVVHLH